MNTLPNHSKLAIAAAVLTVLFASGCERRTPDAASSGTTPPAGSTSDNTSTTPSTSSTATSPAVPASGDTSSNGKSAGTVIDDTVVTTKVKTALLADSDIKGLGINVETSKGVVTLNGAVANQTQIDRAVQVASGVQGVSSVTNNLTIKQ
jgi:hyperosmotically inducible protein